MSRTHADLVATADRYFRGTLVAEHDPYDGFEAHVLALFKQEWGDPPRGAAGPCLPIRERMDRAFRFTAHMICQGRNEPWWRRVLERLDRYQNDLRKRGEL